MNSQPSMEERIWAVISHLSALALGMGLLLPIVGWGEQRQKSKYASFQCLQALGYQSLGYTVWILVGLLVGVFSIFFLLLNMENALASETVLTGWMLGHFSLTFAILGLYFILPVVAAIACALGKEFHYPLMGKRLARYLEYESEDFLHEAHQDRWVAAMGHFSVIIALWGMLAPLTAWIVQGKRSLFLKFQSVQTLVFQAGLLLMYFLAVFIYMLGFIAFIAATGLAGNPQFGSSAGLISLFIFIAFSLIAVLIILAIPLLHILGQWAGYRVLRGDDYRYPLIGRIVEKRLSN
jgi:uncharacterized Tic20 family protein